MKRYNLLNEKEYENLGNNEFPLKYLTQEEMIELGLIKKKCCGSNKSCCKNAEACCKSKIDIKCKK